MKRVTITTIITALVVLAVAAGIHGVWTRKAEISVLKVGFICENDESMPYSYSFLQAQGALERQLQRKVRVYTHSNVSEAETTEPIRELIRAGCDIIFVNNYSPQVVEAAHMYPEVQFCQCSYHDRDHSDYPANYHTFNGEIYQARYVSGIAAGMKLRELIDSRAIDPGDALVGYVGALPTVEVISGYTAFLLGVRSVAPEATLRVRYTGAWSSYSREKACANALIDEGCVIIGQHTDTIGPAMACEEAAPERMVYHVGYNQDMTDIAPGTTLVSIRVNWTPYVVGAVEAMLAHESIEKRVRGNVHGNDISAGFDHDWVQVLGLNHKIAAEGTEEAMDRAIEALKKGSLEVFRGNYTGVDPNDPADTIDLRQGYRENEKTSWPTFHYLLTDVITEEK